jgi:hypothetical protein
MALAYGRTAFAPPDWRARGASALWTALEAVVVEGFEGVALGEVVLGEKGMAEVRDKRIRARVMRHQPSLRML